VTSVVAVDGDAVELLEGPCRDPAPSGRPP
jgi:hypothetical protein